MNKLKVRAHTCYLGHTGYAAHARGFFRSLSKFCDLRVRNFNWDSAESFRKYMTETDLEILDQISLSTGAEQLSDFPICEVGEFQELGFKNRPDNFQQDVDIVLIEPSHYYFFQEYTSKTKIAYTVWESTKVSDLFLQVIQKFDAVWVVSQWHKDCLIEQGVSESKIWVVPEGVDGDFSCDNKFEPVEEYLDNRFKFLFFGRWDYRKSVPEVIEAFLSEFSPEEPVDLVLSADNPFSIDGLSSTEERLEKNGFIDSRIKVKHFPSRQEYLSYLHNGHAMITCARSEGWNIPLCEAIAAGIPVTYSNWGAQLEFCQGMGTPVNIIGEVPVSNGTGLTFQNGYDFPGNYCLPDYNDLKRALREIYTNYFQEKSKAINNSKVLRQKFNWSNIGEIGFVALTQSVDSNHKIGIVLSDSQNFNQNLDRLSSQSIDTLVFTNEQKTFDSNFQIYKKVSSGLSTDLKECLGFVKDLGYKKVLLFSYDEQLSYDLNTPFDDIIRHYEYKQAENQKVNIYVNFIDGAKVEVISKKANDFLVSFYDIDKDQLIFETLIKSNTWCSPNRRWFTNWLITVKDFSTGQVIFEHRYNAENRRVMICLESSSLGDSIAWIPAVEEFRKKHKCEVYLSTFRNELYENEYPELNFISPGSVVNNIYALYRIGWYYSGDSIDQNLNPIDPKTRPLQATSFDILGIDYTEIKTKLTFDKKPKLKRVGLGIHSTAQAKYWNNPTGWQEVTDYLVNLGYEVVIFSREQDGYMGNHFPKGALHFESNSTIQELIDEMQKCEFFIGVSSGLSWLAWGLDLQVIMISGFSDIYTETTINTHRIINNNVCNSCFNSHRLDAGDWLWCPLQKNTDRMFECSKLITSDMVIDKINLIINEN